MCIYRLFKVDRDDASKLQFTGKTIELNRKSIEDSDYPPINTVEKVFALFDFKSMWDTRYTTAYADRRNTIIISYYEGNGHNRCWILKRGI
jgi:hypothetical protein